MRKSKITIVWAISTLLLGAGKVSTRDGVYTRDQAARGAQSYKKSCAGCHGAKLEGTGQTPPLAGADFLANWQGMTADDLFERIQSTMPADTPGKLARSENADILAYLLSLNKFPAGKAELPVEAEKLTEITIEVQ